MKLLENLSVIELQKEKGKRLLMGIREGVRKEKKKKKEVTVRKKNHLYFIMVILNSHKRQHKGF